MIELTQDEIEIVSGEVVPVVVGYAIIIGLGVAGGIVGNYIYDSLGGKAGIDAKFDAFSDWLHSDAWAIGSISRY
ncbi:MAG: hypothetical protein LBF16_13965 [Pseudomonadales bacterium]|jgi:hypothetical protein|nr:hypothetical protein [Pseudomonadales bacterium]